MNVQTWRITDPCGYSNQVSQTVTVLNTNTPVFQNVSDHVLTSCTNVQYYYPVTATSPCCGNANVVFSPANGSFFAPNTSTLVTCVATDCCGNTNSTTFNIRVRPYTLGMNCGSDHPGDCGAPLTFDPPSVLQPGCCPYTNVVFALSPVTNPTSPLSVTTTWIVTNACGESSMCSQTLTVISSPVFTNCGSVTIGYTDPVPTNAPTVTDLCCANLTASLADVQTNATSQGCPLEIDQTWQTVDCYNITSTCVRTVTILPAPIVLQCSNLAISCGSPVPTNPPAVYDAACANVTVTLINSVTNGSGCTNIIYQTWQALDCCGNSDSCIRTVQVTSSSTTSLASFNFPPAVQWYDTGSNLLPAA